MSKLTKIGHQFDTEIVLKFLKRISLIIAPSEYEDVESDNFRFIIHELFLYLVVIGLKNENYKFVSELFYSNDYNSIKKPNSFSDFHNHIHSMDAYYNSKFTKKFYSPMANFLITRIPDEYTKEDLVKADILCHYVAVLNHKWRFPITYVYNT